jgi:hypothetical protein
MKMQLVFVWLGDMQHFHITVLHPHCKPLSSRAVAQRKYLEFKQVMLAIVDMLFLH